MGDQSLRSEVILGVDTHLDVHVGVVISDTGKPLGTLAVPTDKAGYFKLLSWASSLGDVRRAGVEGTGTYGAGLARLLRDHDVEVLEVNRPDRAKRRRAKGSPTPPMPKLPHEQFYLGMPLPSRKPRRAPLKQCAPFPLQGAVL